MDANNQADDVSIGGNLADLADKRREEARIDLESAQTPKYILEVQQTEVCYIISPRCLPFEQADIQGFSQRLQNLYSLVRIDPDMQKFSNPIAMVRRETPDFGLVFENGRFKTSNQNFIAIRSVRLTYEGIWITIVGPSSVADTVVPDVVEQLWASAGVNRAWKDIEPFIQLKSYACATLTDLGFSLMRFLSNEFKDFLDSQFIAGNRFALKMMPLSSVEKFVTPDRFVAGCVVDDINLLFNVFDPKSGRSDRFKLRFNITDQQSYGSNQCVVISELPYDQHVAAINLLRQTFANGG